MDFTTYQAITALQQHYGQILDSNDLTAWPDLFTEDGVYQLQSRENFDAGLPLCVMHLTSQGMLRDRVYAVSNTIYHEPYYQRHVCGAPSITRVDDHTVDAESSYVVIRTQRDSMPQILSVGRYIDRIVLQGDAWKLKERKAVFDNDLIANSIIKPV
jgi:salicylate 5-hydroxylase small subunit